MFLHKNPKVASLLEGKRVALIGPSPHLLGCGLGPEIDKYDLVCRINDIVDKKYAVDYGTKNNVVFHACPTLWISNFASKLEKNAEVAKSIEMVICPKIKAIHDNSGSVVENFEKINKYNIPFWWIGPHNFYHLQSLIGVEPNSGIMAIQILLGYKVQELLIAGFSFYKQYNNKHKYSDCYYSKEEYNRGIDDANSNPLMGHQQAPQTDYIVNSLMPQYGEKIIVDSFLDNLLSLKHNRVLDIKQ